MNVPLTDHYRFKTVVERSVRYNGQTHTLSPPLVSRHLLSNELRQQGIELRDDVALRLGDA